MLEVTSENYSQPQEGLQPRGAKTPELGLNQDLDCDTIVELTIIAQQIGSDFGLEVLVGESGQGSYFSFEPPKIVLDPLQIITDPDGAKFVAGHEGAHRRFSFSPYELFQTRSETDELFEQPGFHATMNTIEDCAVNDGMCRELPGMGDYTTRYYARADQQGLQISTPEIAAITLKLGREPLFARALAEITRDWHRWRKECGYTKEFNKLAREGRYLEGLPSAIVKALGSTRNFARVAISQMPALGERDRQTLKNLSQRRLETVKEKVYPDIKELIEQDIKIEALRGALNGDNNGAHGHDGGKAGRSNGKGSLSKNAQGEIEQAVDQFLREQANQHAQNLKQEADELAKEKQEAKQLEKTLNEQNDPSDKQSLNEGDSHRQKLSRSKIRNDQRAKELKDKAKNYFESIEELENLPVDQMAEEIFKKIKEASKKNGARPLPYEKLSKQTQQEIEEIFNKLTKAERQNLAKSARELIADFEDQLVKALRPKLEGDPIETAAERRARQALEAQLVESDRAHHKESSEIVQQLENERLASLGVFEKTYEQIAADVNDATNRLQRILIPRASLKWQRDQQTGSRLSLARALQSEVDPRYLGKLFERRLNPSRRTHAIEILVDTSDSMKGEKIDSTFKGVVFLSALCESLGIDFEVIEFNEKPSVRKRWHDSIKEQQVRDNLAQAARSKYARTVDADAFKKAHRNLQQKDSMYKFIFVLTDAESSVCEDLKRILSRIERDQRVVVVHFGLGHDTKDTKGYYRHSYGNLSPSQFFRKFCETVEEIILSPEKYFHSQKTWKAHQEDGE